MLRAWIACLIIIPLSACDIPQDPQNSLKKATNGVLHVGYCEYQPWTYGNPPRGIEIELIKQFATSIDSKPQWHFGSDEQLFRLLEKGNITILVCGLIKDSPWQQRVTFSRPFWINSNHQEHLIAIIQGENALLKKIDTFFVNNMLFITELMRNYAHRQAI